MYLAGIAPIAGHSDTDQSPPVNMHRGIKVHIRTRTGYH